MNFKVNQKHKKILDQNTELLQKTNLGLEKESLRMTNECELSRKAHPEQLGSALTHPYITTDYSEALLEFITPVFNTEEEVLDHLKNTQLYTYQVIGDEFLWPYSMPCPISKDENVPIANYGNSHIGKMKKIYRKGLERRYGGPMQSIAGVHFNISLPDEVFSNQDEKNVVYFSMIRNLHRLSPFIIMLFGNSPYMCQTFFNQDYKNFPFLDRFKDSGIIYGPYSTCLRMSNLGYQNTKQKSVEICYNELSEYAKGLRSALDTTEEQFKELGLFDESGNRVQLSDKILQIENEYYAIVRPKRSAKSGESPTKALERAGVEYLELRMIDLNPFSFTGITLEQMKFLKILVWFCYYNESPLFSKDEQNQWSINLKKIATEGRKPQQTITIENQEVPVHTYLSQISDQLLSFTQNYFSEDIKTMKDILAPINGPELFQSEKIIRDLESSLSFATNLGRQYKEQAIKTDLNKEYVDQMKVLAQTSQIQQKEKERQDQESGIDFETFLKDYYERNRSI